MLHQPPQQIRLQADRQDLVLVYPDAEYTLPAEYLGDCIDACVMAVRAGLTVKQVPVEMRERQGGTPSSSPIKSAIYLVRSFFSFGMSMTRKKTSVEGN